MKKRFSEEQIIGFLREADAAKEAARLAAHLGKMFFSAELHELVRRLKQPKHARAQRVRREITMGQTQQLLHQAQHALEKFDEPPQRPALWSAGLVKREVVVRRR